MRSGPDHFPINVLSLRQSAIEGSRHFLPPFSPLRIWGKSVGTPSAHRNAQGGWIQETGRGRLSRHPLPECCLSSRRYLGRRERILHLRQLLGNRPQPPHDCFVMRARTRTDLLRKERYWFCTGNGPIEAVIPPSTAISVPTTKEESEEARKSATFATSSGRPRRLTGTRLANV